jgi:hypothetical protein
MGEEGMARERESTVGANARSVTSEFRNKQTETDGPARGATGARRAERCCCFRFAPITPQRVDGDVVEARAQAIAFKGRRNEELRRDEKKKEREEIEEEEWLSAH